MSPGLVVMGDDLSSRGLGLESRSQIKLIRLKDTFKEAAKSHLESPSSYYAIKIKI